MNHTTMNPQEQHAISGISYVTFRFIDLAFHAQETGKLQSELQCETKRGDPKSCQNPQIYFESDGEARS